MTTHADGGIVVPEWARRHDQHCPANTGGGCLHYEGCPPLDFGPTEVVVNGQRYVREATLFAAMDRIAELEAALVTASATRHGDQAVPPKKGNDILDTPGGGL